MAKAAGYVCDSCQKFVIGNGTLPKDWVGVAIKTGFDQHENAREKDFCSNRCLYHWAKARFEATAQTDESALTKQEKMLLRNKRYNHNRYHADNPSPRCSLCQAETDPKVKRDTDPLR